MNDQAKAAHTDAIRTLNDALRQCGPQESHNRVLVTSGVQERGATFVAGALGAMLVFDAFTADNDPYGEHDFGAFDLEGERLYFKIDYYDLAMEGHSPDPADPAQTVRVLTIMLANEY